jgi:hypothetical protein
LKKRSLLQHFADGDDDFRNGRLKLIPSVPKVCSSRKSYLLLIPISSHLSISKFCRDLG